MAGAEYHEAKQCTNKHFLRTILFAFFQYGLSDLKQFITEQLGVSLWGTEDLHIFLHESAPLSSARKSASPLLQKETRRVQSLIALARRATDELPVSPSEPMASCWRVLARTGKCQRLPVSCL